MPHLDTEKSYSRKLESVHNNNGSHKLFHINFLGDFTAYRICNVVLHKRPLWHDKHIRKTEQQDLKLCWGLLSCNTEYLLILSADNHNHIHFIKSVMTYSHKYWPPYVGYQFLWCPDLFSMKQIFIPALRASMHNHRWKYPPWDKHCTTCSLVIIKYVYYLF
jgi:hypothetical protein